MKHPYICLFLSVCSILLGLLFTASVIALIHASMFSMLFVCMCLAALLFLSPGIIGILTYKRFRKANPESKMPVLAKYLFLFLSIILIAIPTFLFYEPSPNRISILDPYVQESFSADNASLPSEPRFVFYNLDTKKFHLPTKRSIRQYQYIAPYCATNYRDVNVVVAYRSHTHQAGSWVSKDTGKTMREVFRQDEDLYVIRLEDWALIDQTVIQGAIPAGYDQAAGGNSTHSVEGTSGVWDYLADLFMQKNA